MTDKAPQPPRLRPSGAVVLLVSLPLLGMIAAAVVLITDIAARRDVRNQLPPAVALPPPRAERLTGSGMIDFTLPTPNGQAVTLADYAGRIVFLNFWATWCPPCEREMPTFEAYARATADDPNAPVILVVNMREAADLVTRYLDERSLSTLTVLLDIDGTVSDAYGVFNLPTTFIIDGEGIVRFPKYGEITRADIDGYVAQLTDG